MMKWRTWIAIWMMALGATSFGAGDAKTPPSQKWSFQGPFGTFDPAARQRGFQVFKEVCSACHSINLIRYRDLRALGFSEAEVKAIAASYEVKDGPNDEGEMFDRPAIPGDIFFKPYPNEAAARAANQGAYPVDLSLITKARPRGPDYVYAFLTGFQDPPKGVHLFDGKYYNPYFPGEQVAMAPALIEGGVTFADGTKATIPQMAHDVVTFLAWAAEPELEVRKEMGVKILIIFLVLFVLLYFVKRVVWKRKD